MILVMKGTRRNNNLNGLLKLEKQCFKKIKYKDIIEDFISKGIRRIMLFTRS
jgi:hypothetical protein